MTTRRESIKMLSALGLFPLVGFDNIRVWSPGNDIPNYKDYESIDYQIVDFIEQKYGVRYRKEFGGFFRECVQLYSHVYSEKKHIFYTFVPNSWKSFGIPWEEIYVVMEQVADLRGIMLWFAPHNESDYKRLDYYIKERLEKYFNFSFEVTSARPIRHNAQIRKNIYLNSTASVERIRTDGRMFVMSLSDTIQLDVHEYYLSTREVSEWIQAWEE